METADGRTKDAERGEQCSAPRAAGGLSSYLLPLSLACLLVVGWYSITQQGVGVAAGRERDEAAPLAAVAASLPSGQALPVAPAEGREDAEPAAARDERQPPVRTATAQIELVRAYQQLSLLVMGVITLLTVALLLAWVRSERRRRRADLALRRAYEDLEERVQRRTAELRLANAALTAEIIERKQAASALRESERRYREFADSLPQVVFEIDEQARLTFANREALERYGYSLEDLARGINMLDLLLPQDRARAADDMRRAMNGTPCIGAEYTMLARDGTATTVIMHANAVTRAGVPVGVRGVVVDISERKDAEEALQDSERRFRGMLERVQLLAAMLDTEGKVTFCNTYLLQTGGWQRHEIIGRNWFDVVLPSPESEGLKREFARYVAANGEPVRYRTQPFRKRDGTSRTVAWSIIPLYNEQGILIGTASLGEDITDRLQAETALQESEERYRMLFNSAEDAIFLFWLADGTLGGIAEANDAACLWLGRSKEELLALDLEAIVAPQARADTRERAADLVRRHSVLFETTLQGEGRPIPVEVSTHLIEFHGRPAALATARDVSERKRLEEQLRQSYKMESVGRLAGGIAHDFNNLLTAISGHADFALETLPVEAPVRQDIEQVVAAADRAATLTRQLLAFSRRQLIAPQVLNLNELIQDTQKMLRRVIGEHIELVTSLAPDLGRTRADPTQIQQVLINLVVNARDAMPGGGVVSIATENATIPGNGRGHSGEVAPGGYVLLTVTDTGTGMDDEVMSHLFEPFYTTKEVGKGTGMGLPMSYGIIKQHRGEIAVESEPGVGTCFRVYLPRAVGAREPEAAAEARPPVPHGHETVLLVEDEESVRNVAARVLGGLGYRVIEAGDGPEALRRASAEGDGIDLLLTDIVMPQMSGHELAGRLRAAMPDLKVLFVSGYARDAFAGEDGAGDSLLFLQKPFTSSTLAQRVRLLLDGE